MTTQDIPFAISPGQTILDELEARGIDYGAFAEAIGGEFVDRADLIEGRTPITAELAGKLEKFFGISVKSWMRLEGIYRAALEAGKPILHARNSVTEEQKAVSGKLLLRLPISLHARAAEMAKAEGISLNQLLLSYVAEGVARSEGSSLMTEAV